jgi:hypothetical protein
MFRFVAVFPFLSEVAGPLLEVLRIWPDRKHVDEANARASDQARMAPQRPAPEPPRVGIAVSLASIAAMEAAPPLVWSDGAAVQCAEPTVLAITRVDGSQLRFRCDAGAVLRSAGGLLWLPAGSERLAVDE